MLRTVVYHAAESPKIRTRFEALLDDVIACQRPDGYLNSFYTNPIGAHAKVEANRGRIALMRGPVVCCLEVCDNPSGVLHLVVSRKGPFKSTCRPDWLGGAVEVRGPAESLSIDAQGNVVAKPVTFRAVPYYLWSNRRQGAMTVWPASTRDAAL